MAEVFDSTSQTIDGKDGTADFTINNLSYRCILDMMRAREVVEMTNSDTFCIEGVADQEPGRSQIQFEIAGIGKKGGPASGPMIPCPQDVPVLMTFSTGCYLTMSVNFTEAEAIRVVNQNMRITGRGLSKAVYVLTWVVAGGSGADVGV